jgi:hypothetical protein
MALEDGNAPSRSGGWAEVERLTSAVLAVEKGCVMMVLPPLAYQKIKIFYPAWRDVYN